MNSRPRTQHPASLREIVNAMQPVVNKLREIERDAEGIVRQLEGIPSACRGEGPEVLLAQAQERLDRRFRDVVGSPPPMSFAAPDRSRDVLHVLEQLARACGADIDTTRLPMSPRFGVWTADEDLYVDDSQTAVVGGVHPLQRLKFSPHRDLVLGDDGSLEQR